MDLNTYAKLIDESIPDGPQDIQDKLNYLEETKMRKFQIYGTPICGFCRQAKALCEQKGFEYEYFDLNDLDQIEKDALMEQAGVQFRSVPQIFEVAGTMTEYLGGFNELKQRLS